MGNDKKTSDTIDFKSKIINILDNPRIERLDNAKSYKAIRKKFTKLSPEGDGDTTITTDDRNKILASSIKNKRAKTAHEKEKKELLLREDFYKYVKKFITAWFFFIAFVIITQGMVLKIYSFTLELNLNETVVVTLLATTSVNILTLAFVIAKSLFDKK